MKIVAGVPGSFEEADVVALLDAGASELFIGYNPVYWRKAFGFEFSPNRRYRAANQVMDISSLAAVCSLASARQATVTLAFNEHFVTPAAWDLGRRLVDEAVAVGVSALIVADLSFVPEVRRCFPGLSVHVSGDAGVYNPAAALIAFEQGASRIILSRELNIEQIEAIVSECRSPGREFEVFVMGEPCVYDGARCFTEHGYSFSSDFCNYHTVRRLLVRGSEELVPLEPPEAAVCRNQASRDAWALGRCGLCAIPRFIEMGITHLKIPGRASNALTSVRLVNTMLRSGGGDQRLARGLIGVPDLCASRLFCYYPEAADE